MLNQFAYETPRHVVVGSPVIDSEGKVIGVFSSGYGGVERPKTGIAGARVEEISSVISFAEL